jgi:pimeloyl-ACP methyl ester carboxylesterase
MDVIEAGAGPVVVLVHSSMSGARQWARLIDELSGRFHVVAPNLFGYGGTPAWSGPCPPSLDDYAGLVTAALPPGAEGVSLVGHSFGGAVAMQAARRLGGRVKRLVLIEPSLFYLLDRHGRADAFAEISALSRDMRNDAPASPAAAAERFISYWAGLEAWGASPPERRAAFTQAVAVVMPEWEAVFAGEAGCDEWAAALPRRTLLLCAAGTARPSRELVELLAQAAPDWRVAPIAAGGHMAPLTHPHLVNPEVAAFLREERD